MVVGMPHQQQQKVASPAAAPLDAFIPGCGLSSPPSTTAISCNDRSRQQTSTIIKIAGDQASAKCSSSSSSSSGSYKETTDKNSAITKCSSLPSDLSDAKNSKLDSRVKLTDVNPHLVCVLCHGYFVDATSIAECLHSFCRSCIILYLETKNYCPICEVHINSSRPHLSLKPDKTLQDIVYKLVPKLFHSEMKRRQEFYENCPNRDLHLHPESRGITVDRLVYSPDDYICFSLEYYDNNREEDEWRIVGTYRVLDNTNSPSKSKSDRSGADENDNKKFLVCPASVRIAHLKKLIKLKYDLRSQKMIEVFYRRESLPDDYSLMDIAYIYTWKRNSPMRLYYRINLPDILSSDQYYFAVAEKESATQPSISSQTMSAAEEKQTVNSWQCALANPAVKDLTPVLAETELDKEAASRTCNLAESENNAEDRLATDKSDVSGRNNNESSNSDNCADKEKSAKVSSEDDSKQVNRDSSDVVDSSDAAGADPSPTTEKCAIENSETRSNAGDSAEQTGEQADEGKKEFSVHSEGSADSVAGSSADDVVVVEAASSASSTLNSTRQPAETCVTPSAGRRKHEKNNKANQSSELKRLLVTKSEKPPVPNLKALVRQPAAAAASSSADKKKSPALLKSYLSVSSILSSQRSSSAATFSKSSNNSCPGPAANNETATNSAATNGNDDLKAPPKSASPTCFISGVCSSPSFCGGMISLSTNASTSSSGSSSCSNSVTSSAGTAELTVTKSDNNNTPSTKWSSPIINLKQFVTSQPSVARPEAMKNSSKKLSRGGKRSAPPLPPSKEPAKKLATSGATPTVVQNIRKLSTYLVSSANKSVCSNGNNDVSIVEKRSSSAADVSKKKGPVSSVPPIISPEVFITVNPSVACEKASSAANKVSHQADVTSHFSLPSSSGSALNHVVVSSTSSASSGSVNAAAGGPFKLQQSVSSNDKQAKTTMLQNSRISNVSFPIIRNSATPISRFASKSSSGDSSQPSRKRPLSPTGSSSAADKKMRTTCVPSTSIVKKFAGISGDVYNLAKEVEITVTDNKGNANVGDKIAAGNREDGRKPNSGNETMAVATYGPKETAKKQFSSSEHRLIIRNSQVVAVAQQQQQHQQHQQQQHQQHQQQQQQQHQQHQQQQAASKKVNINASGRELSSRAVPGLIEINAPAYNNRFGNAASSSFSSSLTGKKSVPTASNNALDLSSPSSSSAAKSPSASTSPSAGSSATSKADTTVGSVPSSNKASGCSGTTMVVGSNGRTNEQIKTSPKLTPPRALPLMVSPPFRSSSPLNQKPPSYPSSPIKSNPSPTANGSAAGKQQQLALTDFYNSSPLTLKQNFEIQKMLAFQQQHGLNSYSINGANTIKDTKLDDLFLRYMYAAQVGTLPPHPLMFSPRPTKTPSPSFDSCTTSAASPSSKRQK